MSFSIKLDGVQKEIERLKKKSNEVSEDVDAVLQNYALIIAGRARQLAPVDLTGLRSSIGSERAGKLTWQIVADKFYAPYVEFGTGGFVKVFPGVEKYAMTFYKNGQGHMRPHPFIFPAFFENREKLIKDIKEELEKSR